MIAEISRKGWEAFCQRLTEFHRGRMIRIEVLGQTGSMETAADDVPLQRFILEEREGECSDVLLLEAGGTEEQSIQHRIIEPIHLRLKEQHDGRFKQLEIQAESGGTIITFHPGIPQNVLDGLPTGGM
jgi:hypothetical protein